VNYKQAGVDIEEGYRAVSKYKEFSKQTAGGAGGANNVLGSIGGFAAMYSMKDFMSMEEPVLVSGTDGVGTKLDVAFKMKKYDTVGIDCVAMCVNDVLCCGARPLFFLDYLACGKLDADVAAEIVKGVAVGCRESGAALIGGETAEMPGFYDEGKYDIAGFSVGVVDRKKIVDGSKISAGDAIVGIASSGVHSNGFSLVRRVLPDLHEDFGGAPVGLVLLEPTRLYVKPVLSLMEKIEVHGMAHITGGGFYENIPRIFQRGGAGGQPGGGLAAEITEGSWTVPPIFARVAAGCKNEKTSGAEAQKIGAELIKTDAQLRRDMFGTFNMGIGFVLVLSPENVKTAIQHLDGIGFPAWEIGRIKAGDGGLIFV